jgi:hypothetical protein
MLQDIASVKLYSYEAVGSILRDSSGIHLEYIVNGSGCGDDRFVSCKQVKMS